MAKLVRLIKNMKIKQASLGLKELPTSYYNLIIEGDQGTGKSTVAAIYAKILHHYGVIKKETIIEQSREEMEYLRNLTKIENHKGGGVCCLDGIDYFVPGKHRRHHDFSYLNQLLHTVDSLPNGFVCIFAAKPGSYEEIALQTPIRQMSLFVLKMPKYTLTDMVRYAQNYGTQAGYRLSRQTVSALKEGIKALQETENYKSFRSVKLLLDQAIFRHACSTDYMLHKQGERFLLKKEQFDFPTAQSQQPASPLTEAELFAELESLIGLADIKGLVRQIMSYYTIQKQKKETSGGSKPICLHMAFTGNPGTGKTTVARIIGKIFRQLGILPTGQFVEVARGDLIGEYIGHTAGKVSHVVAKAKGGILFIDECYSLNVQDGGRDFGHEAVSTLIKSMEDARDDFAVIFAGYTAETEAFLNMNPGLRERVQFKLHFPDYTAAELVQILEKLSADEEYILGEGVRGALLSLFETITRNKYENFSNGRLARNLFERAKILQATRLFEENGLSQTQTGPKKQIKKEELMTITYGEVKALLEDGEIQQMRKPKKANTIGLGGYRNRDQENLDC